MLTITDKGLEVCYRNAENHLQGREGVGVASIYHKTNIKRLLQEKIQLLTIRVRPSADKRLHVRLGCQTKADIGDKAGSRSLPYAEYR